MHHDYYERLLAFASQDEFREELVTAKAEYFERSGEPYEEDPSYEARLNAFNEWFLLDRELTRRNRTPIRLFLEVEGPGLDTDEINRYLSYTRTRLGLFEVRRLLDEGVSLRDLFTGDVLQVLERRRMAAMAPGDIFEGRLIPFGGVWNFGRGFCHHPRESRKQILAAAKRVRRNGDDPTPLLERLRDRTMRYEHQSRVDVERLYGDL